MRDILNAVQTARVIGCDPHKVRERLKCGIWTFGEYIPAEKNREETGLLRDQCAQPCGVA